MKKIDSGQVQKKKNKGGTILDLMMPGNIRALKKLT